MKVGFTATRLGMSPSQQEQLLRELHAAGATEFHHGCCVGGDAQGHVIARQLGLRVVGHPPSASGLRADVDCDELWPEQPYLIRNREIVMVTGLLIAAPDGPPRLRSGTWATIRLAKARRLPLVILDR